MRQTVLAAVAAFVVGGVATGAVLSEAQPAPPPMQQTDAPPPPPHPWMRWMHMGHGPGDMHRPPMGLRAFALVYPKADRELSPADVQKIAEAFLLWNGNHSWKVANVAATPAGPISFTLTTAEGSAVATFTMDPHTGRVTRVS